MNSISEYWLEYKKQLVAPPTFLEEMAFYDGFICLLTSVDLNEQISLIDRLALL